MNVGIYNHKAVESKWQNEWKSQKLFILRDPGKGGNKFYNLWMFPYPSAEGLHAGHAFSSTGSDVYGRFMRMQGKSVFQPIGYDSFGIHSENYAIKIGETPQIMLSRTTRHYQEQLRSLGHGYDWSRTVTTSSEDYYKWTQWLFLQMFKAGLAYRKSALVNWCPSCKTVLSDEQVMTSAQAGKKPKDAKGNPIKMKEGLLVCERCGTVVEKKDLEQWFFRITDYAERLLENLVKIDWPEKIKIAQRNWIGKKEGIIITYPIKDSKARASVWTSRPDTNFGATFIVVSPEYTKENLLKLVSKANRGKLEKYIRASLNKTKADRIAEGREKTGEFTGLYAINQLNGYEMPIWVADFVLSDVGTGAVVGVPGHDKRDFEFAKEFGLEIKRVVVGSDKDTSEIRRIEQVWEEEGKMINSEFLNGLDIHEATVKIMDYLENKGWGVRSVNYHLRDWLISRQRYWGAPIPMIYCQKCAKRGKSWFNSRGPEYSENSDDQKSSKPEKPDIPGIRSSDTQDLGKSESSEFSGSLIGPNQSDWDPAGWWPEEDLPVELPYISDYKPEGTGRGPLANHPDFFRVACPLCGSEAVRETDVMDTFVDSSWYFLRYPSLNLESDTKMPFDPVTTKKWLPVDLYFGGAEHAVLHLMYARFVTMVLNDLKYINFEEPFPWFFAHGLMIKDGAKMSKSRGNVVNPDEYIEKYGADTLRLYLMFMGPMDGYPDFRDTGIEGMRRFVERIWNLFTKHKDVVVIEEKDARQIMTKMHQTIKKVSEDIQNFHYNTAIAAIMEFVNLLREKAQMPAASSQFTDSPRSDERSSDKAKTYEQQSDSAAGYSKRKAKSEKRIRCAEWDEALKNLALILNPFTPHLSEEVWNSILGQKTTIQTASWPKYNPELVEESEITLAIQVNGKLRGTIEVGSEKLENKDEIIRLAKGLENVSKWLEGKKIKETIFIPGRLINFVI